MQEPVAPITDYFPLEEAREKQRKALDFVERKVAEGCRAIVIEAPTGAGKTALGMTTCLWAGSTQLQGEQGGYYLVTQKLLQDQIERDFSKFVDVYKNMGASVKCSAEYLCEQYGNCQIGGRQLKERACTRKRSGLCSYSAAFKEFRTRPISVTNYPYFFTERTHVKRLHRRQVLVADECHSLERQVLGFIEVKVDAAALEKWAPALQPVPEISCLSAFADWLNANYIPVVHDRWEYLHEAAKDTDDRKVHSELQEVEAHLSSMALAVVSIQNEPENWVYWQDFTVDGHVSIAKPVEAHPYTKDLLFDNADLKLFMSAYIGPKDVFCRTLGLDPNTTAFASLSSTFPVANRPIHLLFAGSMGRKSIEATTPLLLRKIAAILKVHAGERGLIHVHSYKLGTAVYDYLRQTEHAPRLLYPTKAEDRTRILTEHVKSTKPTVLISPSMTEGFSFDDDLARFQIIAKMPYASLGDPQVLAKKERDNDWYVLQTVSTFLQAAGRIVRSDTDFGTTYVLDSDFQALYDQHGRFFPRWLTAAFQWH